VPRSAEKGSNSLLKVRLAVTVWRGGGGKRVGSSVTTAPNCGFMLAPGTGGKSRWKNERHHSYDRHRAIGATKEGRWPRETNNGINLFETTVKEAKKGDFRGRKKKTEGRLVVPSKLEEGGRNRVPGGGEKNE